MPPHLSLLIEQLSIIDDKLLCLISNGSLPAAEVHTLFPAWRDPVNP